MDISLITKVTICACAIIVGLATRYIFKMKDNNPIEEFSEEIIKKQTGVDIDLSPSSPEKENNGKK